MRVIAGQFRSRVLVTPPGAATRPTSDRLRETLFNVLAPRMENARFVDLYAGSGAVGVEALSRGASEVLFVEKAPPALLAIRKNLAALGLERQAKIEGRPVRRVLEGWAETGAAAGREAGWDLVFLDPPYEAEEEYKATLGALGGKAGILLMSGALVVAEHAKRNALPETFGALQLQRVLQQGDAALSFYGVVEPAGGR